MKTSTSSSTRPAVIRAAFVAAYIAALAAAVVTLGSTRAAAAEEKPAAVTVWQTDSAPARAPKGPQDVPPAPAAPTTPAAPAAPQEEPEPVTPPAWDRPTVYPAALAVIETEPADDTGDAWTITARTAAGIVYTWTWTGGEDIEPGDLIAALMSDAGTPGDVTDDAPTWTIYAGPAAW